MAVSYRREIESAEPEIKIDVFYHNEPFDVACDIKGHQIDMNEEVFNRLRADPTRESPARCIEL